MTKPRQILRKMELGGRAWRGESLSRVARAFHRTRHVHELEWQEHGMVTLQQPKNRGDGGQGRGFI